jgi:hypothetical protein
MKKLSIQAFLFFLLFFPFQTVCAEPSNIPKQLFQKINELTFGNASKKEPKIETKNEPEKELKKEDILRPTQDIQKNIQTEQKETHLTPPNQKSFGRSASNTSLFEKVSMPIRGKWVIVIILVCFGIWVWNKFSRIRCPHCRSTNCNFLDGKEIDQSLGTKQESEHLIKGKMKKRNLNKTVVKIERSYKCNACGYDWSTTSKEEMS